MERAELLEIIEFGEIGRLRKAIESGFAQGPIFEGAPTALGLACHAGWMEGIEALLPHSDIEEEGAKGMAPLMCAALGGWHGALARMLQAGAGWTGRDNVGNSALGLAALGCFCESMSEDGDERGKRLEEVHACLMELLPLLDLDEENHGGKTPRSLLEEAGDQKLLAMVEQWEIGQKTAEASIQGIRRRI